MISNNNLIIVCSILLFSCDSPTQVPLENDITLGCIDINADNYDANANEGDGSCIYGSNHPINSLWFVSNNNGSWGIGYNSNVEIGGFQVTISGTKIISLLQTGDAQTLGFSISYNGDSGAVLGFSLSGTVIPAGSGELFSLELDQDPIAILDIVISDENGSSIPFVFDTSYFSTSIPTTGNSHLIIFSSSITTLDVGDEVGIFDANAVLNYNNCDNVTGELLVGSGTWNGTQLNIVSIGSVDMCDFGGIQLSGFQSVNPIFIKIWDVSEKVMKIIYPEFTSGNGNFSDVLTVVSEINY